VGLAVGALVGRWVGETVGVTVGELVGLAVGTIVGLCVGAAVGGTVAGATSVTGAAGAFVGVPAVVLVGVMTTDCWQMAVSSVGTAAARAAKVVTVIGATHKRGVTDATLMPASGSSTPIVLTLFALI
jgi:hypothetical protein